MFAPATDPVSIALDRARSLDLQDLPEGLLLVQSPAGPVSYDVMPMTDETATTFVKTILDVIRNFDPVAAGTQGWDIPRIMQLNGSS
jgi:hypothetical protein